MKQFLWLLAVAVAAVELGLMIWMLPPHVETRVKSQERVLAPPPSFSPPPNTVRRYTVCGIAGAENCWQVGGTSR